MEVLLLGDVEVRDDNGSLLALGSRQRAVLAVLLHRGNAVVARSEIVRLVWGARAEDWPVTVERLVADYVSHLRGAFALAGVGGGVRLVARAPGFVAEVDPQVVDWHRFRVLSGQARAARKAGALDEAVRLLREGLGLWRGRALADLPGPSLDPIRVQMDDLRLAAAEDLAAVELDRGAAGEVVDLLGELAAANPGRERLAALLIRALHAAGRRDDAVAVYQRTRTHLTRELGLDPTDVLEEGYQVVLAGAAPAGPRVVPAQLPADVHAFTGRRAELSELDTLHPRSGAGRQDTSTAVVISAVSGTAGVGKTALALHWAHQARGRFPDGQLYVNLRGYDPDQPMSPADALAGFLIGLGLPGQDIPLDLDDRAARYRTEVAGRRMLVVLDNASSVQQVRPLLPGTATAMVVVTSRDSLPGLVALHGGRRLDLDLLPLPDAVPLLRTLIGPRVDVDPDAGGELARQCARLPLALRVAAELAVSRPTTPLIGLVDELADLQRRLDLLDAGGDPRAAVKAVFSWSYHHLPPDTARTFRLLGLHPGPELDPYAAAALTNSSLDHARARLDLLTRAHLVQPTTTGRYGMHDLLRAYANSLATAEDSTDDHRAALSRLFDYYLATAGTAMTTLHPAEGHYRPRVPPATTPVPAMPGPETARAWLDSELPTLAVVAVHTADHGWPTHTIRLAATLFRYLEGGHPTHALVVHSHARGAAKQTGDPASEAEALHGIGTAYRWQGRYGPAADHLTEALALFRQAGDRVGEARALADLGFLHARLGRYEQAAEHHRQALALLRRAGDRVGEARTLTGLGTVDWRLGQYEQAADHYRRAVALFRRAGDRNGEALAVDHLGLAEQRLGRHQEAADHHRQALPLYRQFGNRQGEAAALDNLGAVHTRLGQPDQAAEYHRQALVLAREIGEREGEAWTLNGLGEAAHVAGHFADALSWHAAALTVAAEIGGRDQQARAHAGLGHAHASLGDATRARQHYQHALTLYTDLRQPEADDIRAHLAALHHTTPTDGDPSGEGDT